MRRFYNKTGILYVPEEEMNTIEQQAQAGDPSACFKLAQTYIHLHECEDYRSSAHKLLLKASEGGVTDADASIAIMMFKGEIEPYDPIAAAKLLEKAINGRSTLAISFQLRNLLYGRYGYRQNIELVKQTVESILANNDDPYWCELMGDTLMTEGKIVESEKWYAKAAEGGEIDSYSNLALARGLDDNVEFRDFQAYFDTLMEGDDAGDLMCSYFLMLDKTYEFDELDPEDVEARNESRDLIIKCLELNADLHHEMSMELLGDIYREGRLGIPADPLKAWEYYLRGSEFMKAKCFEKMYDMLLTKEIELAKMSNEDAMDICMVNGARLHNRKLLIAAVEAYRHGRRLTQFAREIELYHIPAYEALPDDEPLDEDDDQPDDDGRFDPWA